MMKIEILSREKESVLDNHGCSWGTDYRVRFKVNDQEFVSEYRDSGAEADGKYTVIIYKVEPNSKFFFDSVAKVKFLTSPNQMTDDMYSQSLGELLGQNKDFQKYIPEDDRLKNVAEKVFEMSNSY